MLKKKKEKKTQAKVLFFLPLCRASSTPCKYISAWYYPLTASSHLLLEIKAFFQISELTTVITLRHFFISILRDISCTERLFCYNRANPRGGVGDRFSPWVLVSASLPLTPPELAWSSAGNDLKKKLAPNWVSGHVFDCWSFLMKSTLSPCREFSLDAGPPKMLTRVVGEELLLTVFTQVSL